MLRYGKLPFAFMRRRPWIALVSVAFLGLLAFAAVNLWAWHHFRAAERALRDEDMGLAHHHIIQCLRVWSRGSATHLLAARIERISGHYREVEHHLAECIRLQHGATEATQLEAVLLRAQTGELREVEAGLWKCIDTNHPESSQILETLARVYISDSRSGVARTCLDRWLEREPETARAWDWRGLANERLLQLEKAIADDRKALELDPGRWECRLRLARLLVTRRNPEESLPHLEELYRSHPENPEVLVNLARYRHLEGEERQAIQLLDRTLAAHPDFFDALVLRGQLACHQQKPVEGESLLRRALAQRPMDALALYAFYQCLEQQGKASEAAKVLARQKAVEADLARLKTLLDPEDERLAANADLFSEVGAIWLRLGEERSGLTWLFQALRQDENHTPTHEILLRYYESKGDTPRAARHRARLAQLNGQTSFSSAGQR